jgi:hypothetical protein
MSTIACPHCDYVNEIDGAKPGQKVQCLACDGAFAWDESQIVPTFSSLPTARAIAPPPQDFERTHVHEDEFAEASYVQLRKIAAHLKHLIENTDGLSRRVKTLTQLVLFFVAMSILGPLAWLFAGLLVVGGGAPPFVILIMVVVAFAASLAVALAFG